MALLQQAEPELYFQELLNAPLRFLVRALQRDFVGFKKAISPDEDWQLHLIVLVARLSLGFFAVIPFGTAVDAVAQVSAYPVKFES